MNNYFDGLNSEVKGYFNILSPEFPLWLLDYINTPEMERIGRISMSCGTDYSKCFNPRYWYSNLDHSVGVALIIWHFTHDKKQTLAGLFHDIATPVFKHCIDFMNGDAEKQESTEERTTDIIRNSKSIMSLLKNDGINLEEVYDYKLYPIADNDSPKLSADRFEYTFSSGLTFFRIWELETIKEIYNNIIIGQNESGIDELAFKNLDICEKYINIISRIWPEWVSDKDRTVMQFLADMCKSMCISGYLSVDDLYTLSEKEVIIKMINCEDSYISETFKKFQNVDNVLISEHKDSNRYFINVKSKKRYINPLVLTDNGFKRISDVSDLANEKINNFLNIQNNNYYTGFDFEFTPYKDNIKKLIKKQN